MGFIHDFMESGPLLPVRRVSRVRRAPSRLPGGGTKNYWIKKNNILVMKRPTVLFSCRSEKCTRSRSTRRTKTLWCIEGSNTVPPPVQSPYEQSARSYSIHSFFKVPVFSSLFCVGECRSVNCNPKWKEWVKLLMKQSHTCAKHTSNKHWKDDEADRQEELADLDELVFIQEVSNLSWRNCS